MVQTQPDGYHTITPQSITAKPEETIDFAEKVLGAVVYDKYEVDGTIVHAEFRVGDSRMMVGTSNEEFTSYPASTHTYVDDVDATYELALANGAKSLREPEDQFYGDRSAVVEDSQGNQWSLATHIEDVSQEEMHRRMDEMAG
jgi:uncharacterized glyoxalase superfamily protein PhnB